MTRGGGGLYGIMRTAIMGLFIYLSVSNALSLPRGSTGEDSEPVELTSDDFSDQISYGTWWIKFYSPYCPHCTSIAPAWAKTYSDTKEDAQANDVHLASVNCVAYGDLCKSQDIKMYPTFKVFKDGEFIQEADHQHTKSANALTDFVYKHLIASPSGQEEIVVEGEMAPYVPNPSGVSKPLDIESFAKHVTQSDNGWFVKFYAPWCSHCKAMRGTWEELGRSMKGKLNIGEVNCDVDKKLCKDTKIDYFPSLFYYKGEQRLQYEGLRGLGDLMAFAKKAMQSSPQEIDEDTFDDVFSRNDVVFIYLYDDSTSTEDFEALNQFAMNVFDHGLVVKTKSQELAKRFKVHAFPRLVVSKSGWSEDYSSLGPADMRNMEKLMNWAHKVWLPLCPELTAVNGKDVMKNSMMVIAILDRNKPDEIAKGRREMEAASIEWLEYRQKDFDTQKAELRDRKELVVLEAQDRGDDNAVDEARLIRVDPKYLKPVKFVWIDGVFWERWLRTTFGLDYREDGPRVVIYNDETKRYWDTDPNGSGIPLSRSRILDMVIRVSTKPWEVKSHSTVGKVKSGLILLRLFRQSHPVWFWSGFTLITLFTIAFIRDWYKQSKRRLMTNVSGNSSEKSSSPLLPKYSNNNNNSSNTSSEYKSD